MQIVVFSCKGKLKENGSEGLKYLILCVVFFVVPRNGDLNTVKM